MKPIACALLGLFLSASLIIAADPPKENKGGKEASTGSPGANYFPLYAKERWEYECEVVKEDGTKVTGTMVNNIEREVAIEGKSYFSMSSVSSMDPPGRKPSPTNYRVAQDGVFERFDERFPDQLVFRLPAKDELRFDIKLSETATLHCTETIEDVSLSEKTYNNCLCVTSVEYYANQPETIAKITRAYYAADVGLVKEVIKVPNTATVTILLTKHD